jgi:hypothetical protein
MMRSFSHAAVAIILAAQAVSAPANAGEKDLAALRADIAKHTLPCGADFPRNLTRAELVSAFGAAEISAVKVYGAEGEGPTHMNTVLFGKKPADGIQIAWTDDAAGMGVDSISITKGSKWHGPGGVHSGSTIVEIEKANGKPFTFHGLGWDYGGVYHWNGGLFDGKQNGCAVTMIFDVNPAVPNAATDKVEGELELQSTNPILRAANPIATGITVQSGN